MHITDFELFSVPPRWLLLKVTTSDGTVGWGEPIVQGRIEAVRGAVTEIMRANVVGEDPLLTEKLWETMYRSGYHRGGPVLMSAISGIDMALWDIKGKHYGAPVYDLHGGLVRTRLRVDQWLGGGTPENLAASAREMVDAGYDCLKFTPVNKFRALESAAAVKTAKRRVRAVRNAVGDEIDIGVSFHGRVSYPMAKRLAVALEEYHPLYYEEPVLPEQGARLQKVATHTSVPLSTGERLYTRWQFEDRLVDGVASVFHPSVAHVGGVSELRKIAVMAETHDVALAPHCTVGPIAFAASLQVGFCSQSVVMQEQGLEIHDTEDNQRLALLDDPSVFEFSDGYVSPPSDPGLGVSVDEDYVREQSQFDINWEHPTWHYDDGSIAEW